MAGSRPLMLPISKFAKDDAFSPCFILYKLIHFLFSANLAIDLAWMYEFDETQERFNLYQKVKKTFLWLLIPRDELIDSLTHSLFLSFFCHSLGIL